MTSIMLLAGMAFGIGAPAPKDSPKKDVPPIVGEWLLESIEWRGLILRDDDDFHYTFTADGKLTYSGKGGMRIEYTYSLGDKKDPTDIDTTRLDVGKPLLQRGIFRIDDGKLILCVNRTFDGIRPTKFESPKALDLMIMIFNRVKKDPAKRPENKKE